jgi:hypothetical protein
MQQENRGKKYYLKYGKDKSHGCKGYELLG